jgi:long-chain acyl-CoA synthetase
MHEGRLYIRGRIKDILVMSSGEKVPAGDLERAITNDPLFEQALVVGEAKPFVAALVVLEPDAWRALAAGLSLAPEDPSMLRNQRAKRAIIKRIAERLREFPAHAQVRRVQLLLEPWTIDNGLLTPTMKVKRGEVGRHFSAEIQELYAGHAIAA